MGGPQARELTPAGSRGPQDAAHEASLTTDIQSLLQRQAITVSK